MSKLPDEILIMILSRLPMKEAMRTRLLSRKWKNFWKFFSGYMDFDAMKTMSLVYWGSKNAKIDACKFRDWVNRVLDAHQETSVQGLRVPYDMGVYFVKDIDRWIDYAMTKKVQRLELDLSHHISCHKHPEDMYTFPASLLELPRSHSNFDNLTSLGFKSVNVTEQVLAYFLSNCPLLKHLCVHDVPNIGCFSVTGPRLKLKELEILYCQHLYDLKISAAELVVFNYAGRWITTSLEDAPRLSSISLGGDYCRSFFPRFRLLPFDFSQLEKLALDLDDMVLEEPWSFLMLPDFNNFKQLEIRFRDYDNQCILFLNTLVWSFPQLCKFVLKYNIDESFLKHWPQSYVESLKRLEKRNRDYWLEVIKHEHLKVVEFSGWVGLKTDLELAMFLLEKAISLEKMIIDTRDPFRLKNELDLGSTEKRKAARECAANKLAPKLPQGVSLDII